ncbi:MAG: autotransporter assembly complex protein TamA [Pseudomonadota bacterium]
MRLSVPRVVAAGLFSLFAGGVALADDAGGEPGDESSASGRARLEVVLEGLPEYLQPGVRASLSAERQKASPYLDELLVDHLASRAEVEAARAMQASGFYDARASVSVEPLPEGWRLRLRGEPGPIVRIRTVALELLGAGREQRGLSGYMREFPLVPEGPLVHGPYEDFKAEWLKRARERGFLDASLPRHEILVDPASNTADVFLTMDTGGRYSFGVVRFEQAEGTLFDTALLEGHVPWQPGEPYRLWRLLALQRALSDTGYFARVEVEPTPNPMTRTVDVVVRLAARARTRYSFGLGFGTDTGPRGSAEIERRYLNPRGDRVYGRLRLSAIDADMEAEYRRPWLAPGVTVGDFALGGTPRTDYLGVALSYSHETVEDIETEIVRFRLSANDVKNAWRRQVSLTWLAEDDRVDDRPIGRGRMLLPGLKLGYRPRRDRQGGGWWLDLETRCAAGGLLSDTSLLQARADAAWTLPVRGRDQLLLRGSLGASLADDFAQTPLSLRFFAGGDQSVRGYGYKSLGPVDEAGKVVGGQHLVVLSAEYDWMFAHPWGMALFVDAGNAFNDGSIELKTGLGMGLRWRSPVGMVGLDVAHGLQNDKDNVRIHFSLGVDL